MKTDVIILAQGMQSRLPQLTVPKQWLPLPACADTPILQRTIVQLWELAGGATIAPEQFGEVFDLSNWRVTVIGWPDLHRRIGLARIGVRMTGGKTGLYFPCALQLEDPGNSSLKGAKAAITELRLDFNDHPIAPAARTVILLGDVVYSWKCLAALLEDRSCAVVAKTHDLSPSIGELWGVSWPAFMDEMVMHALDESLRKHPPFKEYQPGQLRRWYWQMRDGVVPVDGVNIDDYTDDVDVPADLINLPNVAAAAAADDLTRGITWPIR